MVLSNTNMRHERKYRILHQSFAFVQQMIRHHPRGFRSLYPDRQVNNIYLDTPQLQCYRDNVAGLAERRKYRIRWYGPMKTAIINNPQLEIKLKNDLLGDKQVYPFSAFNLSDYRRIGTTVQEVLALPMALQPTLLNSYQRSYYGLPNQKFRITIDQKLGYAPLWQESDHPAIRYTDAGIIVEIKYEKGLEKEADEILQYLPFRVTKNSKYVSGIALMNAV